MTVSPRKRGFFGSFLDAMVVSRERQSARYVNSALLALDDETLKAHGYTRAELLKRPRGAYPG